MVEVQWFNFNKAKQETFPVDGAWVLVETESGQTFSARFNARAEDFALFLSLWGTQGAVIRWRYVNKAV